MGVQDPSPQTTLLVLLGASAWPLSPEFQSSEAFANAARRLKAYFLNPRPFGLPPENLLDLFDADKSADELDVAMGQFLERRLIAMKTAGTPAKDLLLYFVGHGGFVGQDHDFYLAIRRTRMDNPLVSGLQMTSLAHTLTERARHLRRIIILDCCFAAAAFSAFQGGPDQVALEKTVDAFQVGRKAVGIPTKGTTLLCSSNHKSPSLLLPDGSSTMFTKAFLDALIQGTPSQEDRFTLRDVKDVATDFLSEMRNAPKPVVHSPDQSEGDVADIPFFPNARIEEERWRRAEEERRRRSQEEQARRAEEQRVRKAQEQARKIEEEEQARQAEEERLRLAEEEARAHQTGEERPRKMEELQSHVLISQDPVVVETEMLGSDLQRSEEPIREEIQLSTRGGRISRRKVLAGLAAGGVVVVSGGITWWILAPHPHPHLLYQQDLGQGYTESVAWSPDGKRIAAGGNDFDTNKGVVHVWNATDGGNVYTYRGHSDAYSVNSLAWSPDGKRIASAGGRVQVWNATDGGNVYTYHGHSDKYSVFSVAWSPDGKRIASGAGDRDRTVQVWNATDGGNVYTYRGHSGPVTAVAWSPNGKRIASGGVKIGERDAIEGGTVQVWNATNGSDVYTFDNSDAHGAYVVWSMDGKRIAFERQLGKVEVWQLT